MEGPQFGNQLKQLYVELYIKAITTELNTAIIAEEDQGVSRINAGLSKSYLNFANLVYEYKEIRRECIITAFSLNPTVECLELLKNSANENTAEGEEHNITRENSKVNELPICDLHPPYIISNKSHGELCSQCGEFTGMKKKKLKRMPEGVVDGQDVIEDETESETESGDPYTYFIKVLEPLQLTKDLCHDFISILQNPRDKSFKVIADGTELESICNEYLNYKRTILKELKYLTIDYKVFDGIPRQEEGTGIEKGYEDFLDSTDSSCKRVHKDDVPPVCKRGKPKANEKRKVKATKKKENEDQYYQWSDSSEHSVSDSDATYIPHSKDISTLDSDYSSGNTKKSKKMSISRNHSNLGSIDINIQSNINFQNEREINLSTPELTPDSDISHSDLSHISPSYTPVEETDPIENTNFNTEELSGESQFNECVRKPKFDYPEEVPELDEVATEFHGHFLAPMFYSPDLIQSTDTGLKSTVNIVQLTVPSNANTQNSQLSSNSNSEPPQTSEVNSSSQVALCSEDKSTSQSNSTIPVDSAQFAQSSTSEDFERLSSSTVSQNQSQGETFLTHTVKISSSSCSTNLTTTQSEPAPEVMLDKPTDDEPSPTTIVVVTSYCQPVASPALSVTSQSSSSPCVTPAPIPSSSSTKSSKAKSSKSKSGKTSTSTATSRPSPVPRPQQKPQEDEQTAQRIYAILDEYAEQLRNSPDLKNKPAPRRRSNPPTNPNHSSKRKKSAQTKVKLLGQQSSSTAPEMSPGADDPRTFGSEDSSSGVTQLSHIQDSPAPSTQSADEMGSLRENSSLDASIEAGNLKSVVSDGGDVQGNCQPHRLIFTDANTMQGRAVILHDSVQTISDVTATSSNTSVKPVMMSNTATAVYVPSGLRQVFLPMAPGLTASVQGRPVVVSKGSKVIRVHQVTVPTSLQMSSGTSAVQGAALVVRQMCVKPSVSVATSVSVLNQTTVKQVKLPVGSISSQALSGVSAQPPVVLQPGSHQLAGPIASVETALPHTISFSEPTTQVTKSNVQTDFSRRDKTSVVALDGGVSRPSMLGLIHRGMPVTFQDQLTIPIGETATSLSLHSHDRLVLPNIAQISPSSINDVIVTKKYGTKNVTSDTQHKKSWDCIVTVDDKVSTILTNVAQKSNQQPEDDLSRKALQSSDLNFCSNAMEYTSPNRETSLVDVEYPMQNGSHEITVSISKTNIGDASSLETVKCESPLESKKSCTVTRQLPKYSPKSVLKSDDNVSSDLIGLLCNTPLKHDQSQFEKDDTSNHHTSQSHQRSSNTDGIFGNPNERSLCTSPFTAKMPGTLVSHDELAGEENLFSSVNSSVPASVTVRSPCAFDKFPKNIGQIMDQQIENFRHNSNNNSNSNSSSSDSILRCVAPDHGGSTIVSQGEGLGNPNQSKVGLLCKSSMSTLDCGNEIGYNMRPRVQQLGYANVSSYHLPTKMTLHKGGHWRYVPIVKKVKMPFRTVILQKDSEDAVMMMGHPGSSVNLTDITSEVEDSSQENRTYLPDSKDSVVRKHNADHSLLSYHKLESSQQFEKSNDLLALQQKARVERELRLQKSLSEECEDLGVDEPSTSDLFPEADLLLDTNSSPSFDQTLQDASCSQSLESAERYPNANFRPLEYSSSSQESEQESRLKRQVKLDSKLQNETNHTAYKLNDELSEWQFETTKELKSKTIGESTREKKSKCRGNVLKRRSLDADPKAVPMKHSLIGSTNEKPNDSHSHVMNEHLKISCNSIHTEIVSEKLASKTTRSINDTQSLSSNNTVTVASPGESSFSSSSEESVTLLDSYTNNVVPLDVTVPICSPLPSQSNDISESKDLLPSVTQSVYTYSRIAGKGSKFIKGKDLKCTNQYLVNHLDSQELWDTSSSQERTVVDDEDSESLSRTEDLTSSPPDQSNSDVEIVELSNDSSHYSCVSYSHIPLMKLVVPRLEEILGVNNRSNGLDHIDSTTANCVGDVMANKIHGTRNFFLNRSNIESQLKSSNQNFENKNTSLGRSSKRKLNIEEEPLNHGKRPKTDHSIFSQSSVQKEDAVTVSNIISSNRRIPAASCETSVQSRSQVAVSGCSGEGPCVVQMSSSRLLRRSSLRGHVKRGCSCCNGSPEKPKMKKNVSKVEKSYKKLRTNISKRR
uniref:Ig-like domain-containing protein n=1 Tax=Timema tahoe TaxID=61484 RepID=A0A7R9NY19_9NEOP|nr:unnamed protein product [Timema tahoe]